jgi:UDP-N-acetyl-D-mannosaminuronic acid dehydrogenase
LKKETNSYTSDVTVVGGAGRDGIGLVLALADKGLTINVNDLDNKALEQLKMGQMPYVEAGAARLLKNALDNKRLVFSNSPNRISPQGPVIIVIGTSVDKFSNPSRKSLQDCIDGLLPHMGAPRLIVLRASVFPGTTDWLDGYVKGHGYNHRIAFCPERAVQGVALQGMTSVPQMWAVRI